MYTNALFSFVYKSQNLGTTTVTLTFSWPVSALSG